MRLVLVAVVVVALAVSPVEPRRRHALRVKGADSAAVKGILLCNGQPASNAVVKLMEYDPVDPDDTKDIKPVNPETGEFAVSGTENELFKVEFYVEIVHHCNGDRGREFKHKINVPENYLYNAGQQSPIVYDVDVIDLATVPNPVD
ncbi:CBN-TTR-2 protein [Aphelenchoides avenae]|nr:CBN-TTR-2 protein [Aphelenchus avenae]